jgi:hypothetical protein
MKTLFLTAAAAILLLAAPAFAQEAAPPADSAGAATPQAKAESAPSEGKGKIVFFRPWRLTGGVYTYHVVEVGDDGKAEKGAPRLVSLPNGSAAIYEAEPGLHSYNITGPMAVNKAEDRIRMEVEPGETYYVEQTVRIGVVTGGFRLVPADEARFVESKASLEKGRKASGAAESAEAKAD